MIPLGPSPQWNHYQFSGIAPNSVQWQSDQIRIEVDQTASPLLYTLKNEVLVKTLNVKAQILAPFPKIPTNRAQGQRNADDYILRFGLIVKGDDRLSWLQRRLAPSWLVEMEKQLPEKWGIEKVMFFTTCRQKKLLNQERSHFLSSKFAEKCVTFLEREGAFEIDVALGNPENVIGLWIGSDGDDLKSKFQLILEKIQLNYSKTP